MGGAQAASSHRALLQLCWALVASQRHWGHPLLLRVCSGELSGGLGGAGRVVGICPGLQGGREPWLPMCISETGQAPVLEAADGARGTVRLIGSPSPPLQPLAPCWTSVPRAISPGRSRSAQLRVELWLAKSS